jgi:hypothetical protein
MNGFPSVNIENYNKISNQINSGDLLFGSGNSIMSSMIKGATQSVWSHVAFIVRLEVIDRIMVLESVESIGVRTVPLSSYINNYNGSGKGYPGRIMIARHQDFKPQDISNLSQHAVDLLGSPYNTEEILRIAARIGMTAFGFNNTSPEITPQHNEYICSEYVSICYGSVGIDIPYDKNGYIAPVDFANSPKVKPMFFIATE